MGRNKKKSFKTKLSEGKVETLDQKIKSINFPEGKVQKIYHERYSVLFNAPAWQPNEGLSIISGVNGVGKSHLLKFIKMSLSTNYDRFHLEDSSQAFIGELNPGNLLYVPHDFQPQGDNRPIKTYATLFLEAIENEEIRKKFIIQCNRYKETDHILDTVAQLKKHSHIKQSGLDVSQQLWELSVIKDLIDQSGYSDLTDLEKIEKARQIVLEQLTEIPFAELNCPMSSFFNVFRGYQNLKAQILRIECRTKNLLESILISKGEEFTTSKEEMRSIFSEEYKKNYAEARLIERWGSDKKPWDQVKAQLATFPFFKHVLFYDEERDAIYFADKIDYPAYRTRFESLSSGEKTILTILSWQYICRGHSTEPNSINQKSRYKPDILLLDEPDKHLDPKLCKVFYQIIKSVFVDELKIQVIMTTHKIDTIALAEHNELFSLTKNDDGNIEIAQSHKLLVLFRLTSNLREFTNHHHVVYTESRKDALFYEGVYKTLMNQCNDLRLQIKTAEWQEQGTILDDILSRRIQFSFMSVSDNGDGGGNCGKVIDSTAKDITSYKMKHKLLTNKFYQEIELVSPYGIVDNDYDKKYDFNKIHRAEESNTNNQAGESPHIERIVISKRHSLENYICDPFVLCSVLDIFPEIIEPRFELKGEVESLLRAIKYDIEQQEFENIQPKLEQYFRIFFPKLNSIISYKNKKNTPLTGKQKETHDGILEKHSFLESKKPLLQDSICDQEVKIAYEHAVIKVKYPREFLNVRGHDLAEVLFGGDTQAGRITKIIAERIFQEGLAFIPIDLAEIFFELNHNARIHVRKILKPDKLYKSTWTEKINNIEQEGISGLSENKLISISFSSSSAMQMDESNEFTKIDQENDRMVSFSSSGESHSVSVPQKRKHDNTDQELARKAINLNIKMSDMEHDEINIPDKEDDGFTSQTLFFVNEINYGNQLLNYPETILQIRQEYGTTVLHNMIKACDNHQFANMFIQEVSENGIKSIAGLINYGAIPNVEADGSPLVLMRSTNNFNENQNQNQKSHFNYDQCINSIGKIIQETNVYLKTCDVVTDSARLVYEPTKQNLITFAQDLNSLGAVLYGSNFYIYATSAMLVINRAIEGDYTGAVTSVFTNTAYLMIQPMISYTGIPYVGVGYAVTITAYSIISSANKLYSLSNDFTSGEGQIESLVAYRNLYTYLDQKTFLGNFYDFRSQSEQYNEMAIDLQTVLEDRDILGKSDSSVEVVDMI